MTAGIKHKFPNLIIPGASKSGTTSLHHYLSLNHEILMSSLKEPHYFAQDKIYNNGYDNYLKYTWGRDSFEGYKYVGEASTTYIHSETARERMKNDLTAPRFIFILRDPVERVVSHYQWLRDLMNTPVKPFREEIIEDMKDTYDPNITLPNGATKNYLEESSYYKWIKKYTETFGAEAICIITLENLQANPQQALNACGDFLGVKFEAGGEKAHIELNKTPKTYHEGRSRKIVRVLRPFVPLKVRNMFKSIPLINERLKPEIVVKELEQVSNEDKLWVKGFLVDDFNNLKKFTGRDFNEWLNFRNNG